MKLLAPRTDVDVKILKLKSNGHARRNWQNADSRAFFCKCDDGNHFSSIRIDLCSHSQLGHCLSTRNRFVRWMERSAIRRKEKRCRMHTHTQWVHSMRSEINRTTEGGIPSMAFRLIKRIGIVTLANTWSSSWNTGISRTPICGPCSNSSSVNCDWTAFCLRYWQRNFRIIIYLTFSTCTMCVYCI